MANVLLVAYLLIVLAMIAVILLQRSEGGGLGMGTANSGGFASARGTANLLTRTTAILATLFMASAIGLTVINEMERTTDSIISRASEGGQGGGASSVLDALTRMQGNEAGDLAVPEAPAPAGGSDLAVPPSDPLTPAEGANPDLAVPEAPPAGAGN